MKKLPQARIDAIVAWLMGNPWWDQVWPAIQRAVLLRSLQKGFRPMPD